MIPKIIHYCWFGGKELSPLALQCIASWKKFLPDYEIKRWDETNYDVQKIPYIAQAYKAGKWAFVSDYARFDILYQYGGVYFDTDVEVIKPLKNILDRGAFACVESTGALNTGLGLASPVASPIYKEILDDYKQSHFLKADGSQDLTTVVTRVSDIFKKHGFTNKNEIQNVAGVTIYTTEYFCPLNYWTGKLNITKNTVAIHHYDASWQSDEQKEESKIVYAIYKKHKIFGRLIVVARGMKQRFGKMGIKKAISYYFKKYLLHKEIS